MQPYLERALFVVGPQNSGKSKNLRALFLDRRLGSDGTIPDKSKLIDSYYISNKRCLYLRLTSPHEANESPEKFFDKTRSKMWPGRWCFAGPLQPNAYNQMPDVVSTIKLFKNEFNPERIRVIFLSPTWENTMLHEYSMGRDLPSELLKIETVEVALIDARYRENNGLFLADFFDFS